MSNLFRLIGRRLVALPVMVLGVTLLVFVVMSFSSADPARLALGESATPDALEQYRVAHHLNDPLLKRFWEYLLGLVHGDLGPSFSGTGTTSWAWSTETSAPPSPESILPSGLPRPSPSRSS